MESCFGYLPVLGDAPAGKGIEVAALQIDVKLLLQ